MTEPTRLGVERIPGAGRAARGPGREWGVTLVEALVTLLVLSVGLLGIAALQLVGVKESTVGLRHSQATWLAYDMADRMRANSVGLADNGYGAVGSEVSTDSATDCNSGPCDCDAESANCNGAQMAQFDLYQWGQLMSPAAGNQTLPNAVGTIENLDGNRYRIRVLWDDDVAGLNDDIPDQARRKTVGCPSDPTITQTCVEIAVEP